MMRKMRDEGRPGDYPLSLSSPAKEAFMSEESEVLEVSFSAGALLHELREASGLSQEELAKILLTSKEKIRCVEEGNGTFGSFEWNMAANVLGVRMSSLVQGEIEPFRGEDALRHSLQILNRKMEKVEVMRRNVLEMIRNLEEGTSLDMVPEEEAITGKYPEEDRENEDAPLTGTEEEMVEDVFLTGTEEEQIEEVPGI